MSKARVLLGLAAVLWGVAGIATAQVSYPAPQASDVVAPSETMTGAVGSQSTYARADHTHPRITRGATCTLVLGGTCAVTWSTALSAPPVILALPVNPSASQPVMCNVTATPTTTDVAIKCWIVQTTTLSLAIITTGLSLAPATPAPAGTAILLLAIPPTQ